MDFNVFQKREIIHVFIFLRSSRCAGRQRRGTINTILYTVFTVRPTCVQTALQRGAGGCRRGADGSTSVRARLPLEWGDRDSASASRKKAFSPQGRQPGAARERPPFTILKEGLTVKSSP